MRSITLLAGILLVVGTLLSPSLSLAEKRGVRIDGKTAADYVAEQTGKSWAVVIGIDEYRDPKIRRLKYAVADAQAVSQELTRRGYQVTLLLNGQATERGIKTELRSKLRARAHKDDRVVIYYAGHGQDDKIEGTKTMGYILPVDGELDNIAGSGISMGLIRELADGLAAKQVLFLMDACYGGVAGQQTRALPKMTEAYLKQITREKGRQLITAGGADQEALEASDAGHGLFTYYLLRGLTEGHADLNDDGIIPTSELYAYLDSKVFTDAQMKGHTQRPELWTMSPEKGEFVFFTSARGGGQAPAREGGQSPVGTVPAPVPVPDLPSAALSQAEQERLALEEEERKVEEQAKHAALQRENEERKRRIEEKKKQLEVASLPTPSLPRQTGREITGKDGAPMLLIPAGEFMMGSTEGDADEKPVHRVSLDAFYLDKYEVTNKLFQQFARTTGYETTAEKEGKAWAYVQDDKWTEVSGANWRKPEGGETVFVSNRDEHPVVSVSWYDAEAYCRWAGKRLPTEAEFEYANRGGTQTTYWWGDGNPGSRRVANVADITNKQRFPGRPWPIMEGYDDGYGRTAPVGSFDPNPFGLHDTTGNVLEWTADWYGKDYYERSPSRNPSGPSSGDYRVLRGGSWGGKPQNVRSAHRSSNTPSKRDGGYGFRCAKTP